MNSRPRPFRSRPAGGLRLQALTLLLTATTNVPAQTAPSVSPPRIAALGTCSLSSGAAIPNCRVAYRSFGPLSAARDNVVLIPTFFAGRSEDHLFMLGTYVDTTRSHVVIVDALADGHSSSPSNTPNGGSLFSALTIGDMVDVQHRFLTEYLGVKRLRAVVGISMGGFQAFEWAVRYPDFMNMAVSIVGTPRATPYNRLVYSSMQQAALTDPAVGTDSAWVSVSRVENLFMRTARSMNDSGAKYVARSVDELAAMYRSSVWSRADYVAQTRALGSHDVSQRFGGDMTGAAAAVRARMLVVWSPDDMMVEPQPAAAFARLTRADTLVVRSDCGHSVFWCDAERIGRVVRAFLAKERSRDAMVDRPSTRNPRESRERQ